MSPRFVLGRENVPCVAEVVNRSLKLIVQTLSESWQLAVIGLRESKGGWQVWHQQNEFLIYGRKFTPVG